jgi:type VI secretion system secreted protein VgrG
MATDNSMPGNRQLSVGTNDVLTIGGDRNVTIGRNDALTVTASKTVGVGKTLRVQAGDQLELVCGAASLLLKKDGTVIIRGKDITLEGSGKINIKASADVVIKGNKITQN